MVPRRRAMPASPPRGPPSSSSWTPTASSATAGSPRSSPTSPTRSSPPWHRGSPAWSPAGATGSPATRRCAPPTTSASGPATCGRGRAFPSCRARPSRCGGRPSVVGSIRSCAAGRTSTSSGDCTRLAGSCATSPSATVRHEPRAELGAWLAQRVLYGSTAGPLARHHPRDVAPVMASPWTVGAWLLVAARRPVAGAAVTAVATGVLARRLAASTAEPSRLATLVAARGTLLAGVPLAANAVRSVGPARPRRCRRRPTPARPAPRGHGSCGRRPLARRFGPEASRPGRFRRRACRRRPRVRARGAPRVCRGEDARALGAGDRLPSGRPGCSPARWA